MIEMATKKLQNEIMSIKETLCSMAGDINSLKSQISRLQFQPPQTKIVQKTLGEPYEKLQPKNVEIVDCRPENEKHEEFQSSSSKNSEPLKPRYGDYQPEDVSIDKFFYFGRK